MIGVGLVYVEGVWRALVVCTLVRSVVLFAASLWCLRGRELFHFCAALHGTQSSAKLRYVLSSCSKWPFPPSCPFAVSLGFWNQGEGSSLRLSPAVAVISGLCSALPHCHLFPAFRVEVRAGCGREKQPCLLPPLQKRPPSLEFPSGRDLGAHRQEDF